jgi:ferredoxin-NADP reductase
MAVAQKLRCRVEGIEDHGDHVYTVELRPERPAPRFRPGQFLHLALDEYDPSGFWPESRVFSIANSPLKRDRLRISYSVRGRFTARMERELADRRWVWVKLPSGDFVIDESRDVVLFAGGTGITAFIAFLGALSPGCPQRVDLFYGAREPHLLIYREVVQACARRVANFHPVVFLERGAESGQVFGRLSVAAAWPYLLRPQEATYYLSGPPAMLAVLSGELRDRGVPGERTRLDAWE